MGELGKRLVLDPAGQVQIESFEVPNPASNQILVRILVSQVSAGSEINGVRQRRQASPEARKAFTPQGMGYTTVGRIEAVGSAVTDWEPGERVLCFGNHGTHWLITMNNNQATGAIPNQNLIERVPATLSDTEIAFAVLGDVALHGVRRAQLQIGESVAIYGLGVVGLLTLQLASCSGAFPLIGVDIVPERLDLAQQLGASHTINALEQDAVAEIHAITELPWRWSGWLPNLPPGTGAEVQLQTSSNIRTYETMLKAAADRGRLVMVGAAQGRVEVEAHELLRRELTVRGSYQTGQVEPYPYWPWHRVRNRQIILAMIARRQLNVQPLISHVVPYTEAPALYDVMAQGGEGWMSIFFTWDESTP